MEKTIMEKTVMEALRTGTIECNQIDKQIFNLVNKYIDAEEWNYETDISVKMEKVFNKVLVHVVISNKICEYNLYLDVTNETLEETINDLPYNIFKCYRQISTVGCLSLNLVDRIRDIYRGSLIEYSYSRLEISGEVEELK